MTLDIRRSTPDELDAVVRCCAAALGWRADDPNRDFFRWKHRDNHFGPSPIWVAVDDGEVVGARALMQWQLRSGSDVLRMVRAVDTATLPSHQGQGIFTRLTMAAVEELESEGVDAIFNTPNEQSRPGYLKMGWTDLGRAPIGLRIRGPLALPRMIRSRVAAGKWGEPTAIGTTEPDLAGLASTWTPPTGWHTPISADYLAWRYGFEPLGYRFIDDAVVRVRTRGSIRELSVCDIFGGSPSIGTALRGADADVAIAGGTRMQSGFVSVPRLGPRLTWRALAHAATPALTDLDLSLGTLELF